MRLAETKGEIRGRAGKGRTRTQGKAAEWKIVPQKGPDVQTHGTEKWRGLQ